MNKQLPFPFFLPLIILILVIITSFPVIAQEHEEHVNNSIVNGSALNNGECPFPLISLSLTGLSKTEKSICLNDCCLSCPIANNFYKENEIDLIFKILSIIRVISFVCVLIIVISYIVLPNKREHPAVTVLCFNLSLLFFTGVTFFYIGDIRRIQCADLVTQATIKNNALCGAQGVVLVFSTFLLIIWCFLLILHLHFQTVWRSNIIQRYHVISQTLVLLISGTFTILPTVMGEITFEFGATCMVSQNYSNELFWYPLAFFAIPGVLIHFWTFIYIGKSQCMLPADDDDSILMTDKNVLKTLTGQEIVKAIKIQWRALMLAILLLVTYNIYWTYTVIELSKLSDFLDPVKPLFLKWLYCIFENGMNSTNAQNICSDYAKDHVPDAAYITTAESATALLGIGIFIVFGTSIDLWSEWKLYFVKKFGSVSTKSSDNHVWA